MTCRTNLSLSISHENLILHAHPQASFDNLLISMILKPPLDCRQDHYGLTPNRIEGKMRVQLRYIERQNKKLEGRDQNLDIDALVNQNLENGTVLNLENKKIGDAGLCKLAKMEILKNVTRLELGENEISDAGLATLCQSPHIAGLRTLNLKSNNITAEGARVLAESEPLSQLDQLVLKFNRIGDEGAKHLADSKYLTRLSTLDLFRNRLTPEGAQVIKSSANFKRVNRIRLD